MSRRNTLSALSPSQLNVRSSLAPSRVSTKDERSQKSGRSRKSVVAQPVEGLSNSGLERRSSTFNAKSSGPRQDPRNIGDKNFQSACIRTVVLYLSTHSYPAPLSPKALTSPTAKEFTTIIHFLIQKFDPNMKTFGKIEDDVPQFFKRINYPFQISKSALFAVGSPHSWPAVLAAITWLVELLNYNDKVEGSTHPSFDDSQQDEKDFYEYVSKSYRHFLAGEDEFCDEADDKLLEQFTAKEKAIRAQLAAVKAATEQLSAELTQVRNEPSPLVAAKQRRSENMIDKEKLEQLLESYQAQKVVTQRRLAERQQDLKTKQEQISVLKTEIEELKLKVSSQTVNKSDLQRMVHERAKQREILEAVNVQVEEEENTVHQQEVAVVHAMKGLEAAVSQFTGLAHRLKLTPATAKRANGLNFDVRICRDMDGQSSILNVDVKNVLRPALERLSEQFRTRSMELGRDLLSLRDSHQSEQDQIHEKTDEVTSLEQQIARVEAHIKSMKDLLDEKVKSNSEQAEKLKMEVDHLRNNATNRVTSIDERRKAAVVEYESLQRKCDAEILQLQTELQCALEAMVNHRMYVKKRLEQGALSLKQVLSDVRAVRVPTSALV